MQPPIGGHARPRAPPRPRLPRRPGPARPGGSNGTFLASNVRTAPLTPQDRRPCPTSNGTFLASNARTAPFTHRDAAAL
ncbi:MAG TPA: hypothetical protein VGH76_24525 [Actinomycetospora sp.]|uniref:hypothetical protein n=1 Tax=Actinomycetospora sp. TaxID=1872135 RepID=UPI002F3FC705